MRKGEIWDVVTSEDGRTRRVLVVSAGEWHPTSSPQAVAIIRRHGMDEILPFTIALHEHADSVAGMVYMTTLMPIDPGDFKAPAGSVSGGTLAKVDASLRKIFAT
jgi:mRNA-degrading endonuclease toxin of MazEF toxin-antitoxin module